MTTSHPTSPDGTTPDAAAATTTSPAVATAAQLPDLVRVDGERRPLWMRVLMLVAAALLLLGAVIVWIVPVVGGSWFLYIPGFILLGTASRRCGLRGGAAFATDVFRRV